MNIGGDNPNTTYAFDLISKRLVHIDRVERGLACNCVCPACKEAMQANKGQKNIHYFCHDRKSGKNIEKCHEITMHMLAEQIIKEKKMIKIPKYSGIIESRQLCFKDVEVEERNDRSDIQPDIVGITEEGHRYLIEIKFSHAVDSEKKAKIYNDNLTCVEIDISKQSMDDLEDFLLNRVEDREWINNKYAFDSIVDWCKKDEKNVSLIEKKRCKGSSVFCICDCLKRFSDGTFIEIAHCGEKYIICVRDTEKCIYDIEVPKENVSTPVVKKDKRPINNPTNHYRSNHRSLYIPRCRRKESGDEPEYLFHPGNFFTTLKDYYNKVEINKVFYRNNDNEYFVTNKFEGNNCFIVICSIRTRYGYKYTIAKVTQPDCFLHEWFGLYE